jgi:hypothetical protein
MKRATQSYKESVRPPEAQRLRQHLPVHSNSKAKKNVQFADVHSRGSSTIILGTIRTSKSPINWLEYTVEEPSSCRRTRGPPVRFRLRKGQWHGFPGTSWTNAEASIRIKGKVIKEERRRKIQIVKEWTYRMDPKDTTPCTCHYGQIFDSKLFNKYKY